jgi:hypothetical protein
MYKYVGRKETQVQPKNRREGRRETEGSHKILKTVSEEGGTVVEITLQHSAFGAGIFQTSFSFLSLVIVVAYTFHIYRTLLIAYPVGKIQKNLSSIVL